MPAQCPIVVGGTHYYMEGLVFVTASDAASAGAAQPHPMHSDLQGLNLSVPSLSDAELHALLQR